MCKDSTSFLHVAHILKRAPRISIPFLLDLNSRFLWVNCEQNYSSSTYIAPSCNSTQCSRAGVHYCHKCPSNSSRTGCHNSTCFLLTNNPLTRRNAIGELAQDVLSIYRSQGPKSSPCVRVPYLLFAYLEHSLFRSFAKLFMNQLIGVPQVKPVLQFEVCFNFNYLASTRTGPEVPRIDFMLQNQKFSRTIIGENSTVQVEQNVSCLAFVDGGTNPTASIVIATHQLENNLLQFGLAKNRLGFASSLLLRHITCANFNFTLHSYHL
nr:LOW QUALITY PROTEIN: basic 7S globulin-like [Coffea arabica]